MQVIFKPWCCLIRLSMISFNVRRWVCFLILDITLFFWIYDVCSHGNDNIRWSRKNMVPQIINFMGFSFIEGSLAVKLLTIWTVEKVEMGRVREEKRRRKKIREEKVRRKKRQVREKVGKSRFTVFYQWFVASEGRKVGSLKRRVRSHVVRWETKNCTPLWREAHFQVKMYKTRQLRTTFGSWDVEKVRTDVARSTCLSQNVQNTPGSEHFWKFWCQKSARWCGAKQISKSKWFKMYVLGPDNPTPQVNNVFGHPTVE